MSKAAKIWIITAFSLILIGCIVFVGVMTVLKWDFTKLSTGKYETNRHGISEDFSSISIISDTADISFAVAESCAVECHEQKNMKHSVSVKDGVLTIELSDTRKWYEFVGSNFNASSLTVYLPQKEYSLLNIKESTGDVDIPSDLKFEGIDIEVSTGDIECYASVSDKIKIKTTTGKINIEDISAGEVDLSVSTGNVSASRVICGGDFSVKVSTGKSNLSDISCKNLTSSGSTGDISLKNVIAEEMLTVKRSTGKVNFDSSDATEIFIKTDTGDVVGSLLSNKIFITNTDTGHIDTPSSVSGGRCEITTDTGNIKITVK